MITMSNTGSGNPSFCAEMQVVIVKEPVCVLAPGEIRYVSSNMELLDKNRARLVSDTGLTDENAQVVTDAYGIVIYEGKLGSLRRFENDAKEVNNGFECGMTIENYNDIKVDDIIEAYGMEVKNG